MMSEEVKKRLLSKIQKQQNERNNNYQNLTEKWPHPLLEDGQNDIGGNLRTDKMFIEKPKVGGGYETPALENEIEVEEWVLVQKEEDEDDVHSDGEVQVEENHVTIKESSFTGVSEASESELTATNHEEDVSPNRKSGEGVGLLKQFIEKQNSINYDLEIILKEKNEELETLRSEVHMLKRIISEQQLRIITLEQPENDIDLLDMTDEQTMAYFEIYDDENLKDINPTVETQKQPTNKNMDTKLLPPLLERKKRGTKTGKKRIPCHICGKTFQYSSYVKLHVTTQHMNLRPYKCGQCLKTFTFLHHLKAHEKTHLPNYKTRVPAYTCKLCPKAFRSNASLMEHIKAHQCGGYHCADCGNVLWTTLSFRRHMAAHERKKQMPWLKCNKCESVYKTKLKLERHTKLHDKMAEHRCKQCNRIFHSRSHLQRHNEVVHLKIKSHTCTICGKSFSTNANAKQHGLRIHNPDKWIAYKKKREQKRERPVAKIPNQSQQVQGA